MRLRVGLECKNKLDGVTCKIININHDIGMGTIVWETGSKWSYPLDAIYNYYRSNIIVSNWQVNFNYNRKVS